MCLRAGLDHRCHLLRAGGPHNGQRFAMHALAPVLLVGAQVTVGQNMGVTHNATQCGDQLLVHFGFLNVSV